MKAAAWIILIYGIVVLVGGVIGHLQAGSAASLITGASFGILLLLSSIGMFRDHLFPTYAALILTLLLDAFFTYRWVLTMKFFPAGIMSLLSLIVLIAATQLVKNHLKRQR